MNNLRCYIILFFTVVVLSQDCLGVYHDVNTLKKAVLSICCDAPNGKRGVISHEKKAVSAFLKPKLSRRKKALYYECCIGGCYLSEILSTTLREECIHEGCSVEEIDEVC